MPLFGPPNIRKLEEKRDVDGLIKALSHSDARTRRKAAEALGNLGDVRAVEPLIAVLEEEAWEVREAAASALQKVRDPGAVGPLVAALRSRGHVNRFVEVAMLEALGEFCDPRLAPEFAHYVHLGDLQVREIARRALRNIGDAATGPLIAALREDEGSGTRCAAARALVLLGVQQAVDGLVNALQDESHFVRAEAASGLEQLGDARAVQPLIAAVGDGNLEVRARAAEALVSLAARDPAEVVEALRGAFAMLLGIFSQETAELRLKPSFPTAELRMKLLKKVAALLGEVGDERAVDALAEAFERAPNYVPEVINRDDVLIEGAQALAQIGTPSVRRLIELLARFQSDTDMDRFRRASLVEALERIGGPEAERALAEHRARQE